VVLEIGKGGGQRHVPHPLRSIMITTVPPLTSHLSPLQLPEKAAAEDLGAQILKQVLEDFMALEEQHKGTPAEHFNDDAVYKRLTAEAIEGKTMALKKARVCAGQANRRDALARYLARPLADFATRGIELEAATGLASSVFPWEELRQSSTVNFGRWRSKDLGPDALRAVWAELAKNENLRVVTLEVEGGKTVALSLPKGRETKKLEWMGNAVVALDPGLALFLVNPCVELEELDAR
jgi:hypothetical protein